LAGAAVAGEVAACGWGRTDAGRPVMDEMQKREILEGLDNLSQIARAFFLRLVTEGFTEAQALALTQTWLRGVSFGGGE
jgi:hypothetical protein